MAQVEDAAAYKDGTYYGSGTGFGGPLKVMVEISGGKIASIQIVENSDGSDYISKAASLIDSIIATQSTNVDTVSGATYSSVGIIQAVRDALSQAAVMVHQILRRITITTATTVITIVHQTTIILP